MIRSIQRLRSVPRGFDDVRILGLALVAAVAGLLTGLVAGSFRWCLFRADNVRDTVLDWSRSLPGPGWIAPVLIVAASAAAARLVVRWVPEAAGSGIQDVEAAWRRDAPPPSAAVVPAKFAGGLVAIGSGLALGREGPTVHMGAAIGAESGRRLRFSDEEIRVLQTALGGAGLAVAFNAPLGGALFVFEEAARTFRFRLGLVTLISCASAVAASRIILPDASVFAVGQLAAPSGLHLVVFAVFGLLAGLVGRWYNVAIIAALRIADRLDVVGPETRAATIGAVVGLLLFIDPFLAGDGDALVQRLLGGGVALASIAIFVVLRFLIGPISYAAGTPGGLFAPLLAVGAVTGLVFHQIVSGLPGTDDPATAYIIVGMAALFVAVVRAPFTGIVLVLEMTANTTLVVAMLVACSTALLVASLAGPEPIYDRLWERVLQHRRGLRDGPGRELST